MESKITLRLKKRIIEKGKRYAKKNKTSLSKLVEKYIDKLEDDADKIDVSKIEITPLVKSLSIKSKNTVTDHKKEITRYLAKKYK